MLVPSKTSGIRSLKLELEAVVSHLMWVLGMEPRPLEK
jgi:NADH:ubiquinone oxidoreductase subunit D